MRNPRVAHNMAVFLGDVVRVSGEAVGCQDQDCDCGDQRFDLVVGQIDGTQTSITMPVTSWATVATFVMRFLSEEAPRVLARASDVAEQIHKAEQPRAIPLLYLDARGSFEDPSPREQSLDGFLDQVAGGINVNVEDWIRFNSKAKVHCIAEVDVDYEDEEDDPGSVVVTYCGRIYHGPGVYWERPRAAEISEICVRCRERS